MPSSSSSLPELSSDSRSEVDDDPQVADFVKQFPSAKSGLRNDRKRIVKSANNLDPEFFPSPSKRKRLTKKPTDVRSTSTGPVIRLTSRNSRNFPAASANTLLSAQQPSANFSASHVNSSALSASCFRRNTAGSSASSPLKPQQLSSLSFLKPRNDLSAASTSGFQPPATTPSAVSTGFRSPATSGFQPPATISSTVSTGFRLPPASSSSHSVLKRKPSTSQPPTAAPAATSLQASVSAKNSVVSAAARAEFTVGIPTWPAEQLAKFRDVVKFTVHAFSCDRNSDCDIASCPEFKQLQEHQLLDCVGLQCQESDCLTMRYIWDHFMHCASKDCPACGDILPGIAVEVTSKLLAIAEAGIFKRRQRSAPPCNQKPTDTNSVASEPHHSAMRTLAVRKAAIRAQAVEYLSHQHSAAECNPIGEAVVSAVVSEAALTPTTAISADEQRIDREAATNVLDQFDFSDDDDQILASFDETIKEGCADRSNEAKKASDRTKTIAETSAEVVAALHSVFMGDVEILPSSQSSQEQQPKLLRGFLKKWIISRPIFNVLIEHGLVLRENAITTGSHLKGCSEASFQADQQRFFLVNGWSISTRFRALKQWFHWLDFCGDTDHQFHDFSDAAMFSFQKWLSNKAQAGPNDTATPTFERSSITSIVVGTFACAKLFGFVLTTASLSKQLGKDASVHTRYMIRAGRDKSSGPPKTYTVLPREVDTWCSALPKSTPAEVQNILLLQLYAATGLRPSSVLRLQLHGKDLIEDGGICIKDIAIRKVCGELRLEVTIRHFKELKNPNDVRILTFQPRKSPFCLVGLMQHQLSIMGAFQNPRWAIEEDYTLRASMSNVTLFSNVDCHGNLAVGEPLRRDDDMFDFVCAYLCLPRKGISARSLRRGFLNAIALHLQKEGGFANATLAKVIEVVRTVGPWTSKACYHYLEREIWNLTNTQEMLRLRNVEASSISIDDAWPYLWHSRLILPGEYCTPADERVIKVVTEKNRDFKRIAESNASEAAKRTAQRHIFEKAARFRNSLTFKKKRARGFVEKLPEAKPGSIDLMKSMELSSKLTYFRENTWVHPPFVDKTFVCPDPRCAIEFPVLVDLIVHCNSLHKHDRNACMCPRQQCRTKAKIANHLTSLRVKKCRGCDFRGSYDDVHKHAEEKEHFSKDLAQKKCKKDSHYDSHCASPYFTEANLFPIKGVTGVTASSSALDALDKTTIEAEGSRVKKKKKGRAEEDANSSGEEDNETAGIEDIVEDLENL